MTTTDDTTDRDVFLRAIDVLEKRGWCKAMSIDKTGAVCAEGAIREASGLPADWFKLPTKEVIETCSLTVIDRADQGIRRFATLLGASSVWFWNDDPSRTYEDVVLALKRAAHGEGTPS